MKKINARLSFNTNGWQKPSGVTGKSTNQIHEKIFGFGFEEWLFNESFVDTKDKWHFGYIEGIHKNFKTGDDNNSTLHLFTIDARTKRRYIVAEIKEWKKLSQNDSKALVEQNPELITQMKNNLSSIHNPNAIGKFLEHQKNQETYQLFNIKFKKFSYCFDIKKSLEISNRIYELNRFWLYR